MSDGKGRSLMTGFLDEPLIEFAGGGLHVDPKAGIARYGPRSLDWPKRHPDRVTVGFIGTAESVDRVRQWLDTSSRGVLGTEKHPEFPGFQRDRGFMSDIVFDDGWIELLSQTEVGELLDVARSRPRFEAGLELLDGKLKLLAEQDRPPTCVFVCLPDELRRIRSVDYRDRLLGDVHRDLRRALKSRAMRYRIPTQFVDQETVDGRDDTPRSKIAWNLFTGLYFKAGGVPWAPHTLTPNTCFIGISFFRPLGSRGEAVQASLVQAFDERGEGLVLRGHDFEWDPDRQGRAPHLDQAQAGQLITLALDRYEGELKHTPRRVVVHKTSRYWPDERMGFEDVLRSRAQRFDLVALEPQQWVRLLTTSMYPPLRGTRFSVGQLDYLYTTGFIAPLGEYHAMGTPSPLLIADHVGQDTPRQSLLTEILALTKLNWNGANYGGLLPITLRFARLVGDILREIPSDREPLPQFKFYM